MLEGPETARWREVLARLRRGPSPRGEQFDLCRELLARAPSSNQAAQAVRLLLEGAIADVATGIDDAQAIMELLKAADRGSVEIAALIVDPSLDTPR
jgi:hypothetical protein